MGRGLLGAVGVPLSGALNLVSGVAAGIGATTGVLQRPCLRRPSSGASDTLAPEPFSSVVFGHAMMRAVPLSCLLACHVAGQAAQCGHLM